MSEPMTQLPAAPVVAWLSEVGVPKLRLARFLSERTGRKIGTWHRLLTRLPYQSVVSLWIVDEICTTLGAHVSRFDSFYASVCCEVSESA